MAHALKTSNYIKQIGKYIDVTCNIVAPSLGGIVDDQRSDIAQIILTTPEHLEEVISRFCATVQIIVLDDVDRIIPVETLERIKGSPSRIDEYLPLSPSVQCVMVTSLWADTRISSVEQLEFVEILETPMFHPVFGLEKLLMCRIIDLLEERWKNDALLDLLSFVQTKPCRIKSRIYFDSPVSMEEVLLKLNDVASSTIVCIDGTMGEEVSYIT